MSFVGVAVPGLSPELPMLVVVGVVVGLSTELSVSCVGGFGVSLSAVSVEEGVIAGPFVEELGIHAQILSGDEQLVKSVSKQSYPGEQLVCDVHAILLDKQTQMESDEVHSRTLALRQTNPVEHPLDAVHVPCLSDTSNGS